MGRSGGVERGGLGRGQAGLGAASGAALAALIAGTAATQAQAQTPAAAPPRGDFPTSTSEADILRWVATRTSIPRGAILLVEPRAVVSLGTRTPAGSPGTLAHAEVHEELISPDATTRSALFSVDLDCSARKFRIIDRKTFPLPDLKGEGQLNPQPGAWSPVVDGAPVAKAWQAVCTTDFVHPYGSQASTAPLASRTAAAPSTPPAAPVRRLATAAAPAAAPAPRAPPSFAPPAAPERRAIGGAYEAVLGSYSVRDNAVAASEKAGRVLAGELQGHRKSLVTVTVKGQVFTALTVSGFATAADASGFCNAARAVPLACMVRRGGAG